MRPLAVDLYCGLGGWTNGLLAEGWDVIGFDIEAHAYDGERYPAQLVIQDVLTLHGSQFRGADLIVASPPCQEFSYMAMPWTRAKAIAAALRGDGDFPEGYRGSRTVSDLTALFDACFRIQRGACAAAGRHIPMVVENVRGAQPWVGRARWNFGSFYVWGDVPAIMPREEDGRKVAGFPFDGGGGSFQTAAVEGTKAPGLGHGWKHPSDPRHTPGLDFTRLAGAMKPPARSADREASPGRKSVGSGAQWFDQNIASLPSNSSRRKAASARIAKIPETLSRYIGRVFLPPAESPAA